MQITIPTVLFYHWILLKFVIDTILNQLTDVVNKIISCPDDRRIVLSSYSPLSDLKMELPYRQMVAQVPNLNGDHTHHLSPSRYRHNKLQNRFTILIVFVQLHVSNGELSCQTYQESADVALDLPYSIASGALLTRTIAHLCGTYLITIVPFRGNPGANFLNCSAMFEI